MCSSILRLISFFDGAIGAELVRLAWTAGAHLIQFRVVNCSTFALSLVSYAFIDAR